MLIASSALFMSGCEWIDDVGRHMPVIGERCENWQCFTEGGRAQSEANKRALAVRGGEGNESARKPINGNPVQPASPVMGTDQKKLTPFDMTPEQLQDMPAPSNYQ